MVIEMTATVLRHKAFAWALMLGSSLSFAIAICAMDTLPFVDLPFRMAAAAIYAASNTDSAHSASLLHFYEPSLDALTPTAIYLRIAGGFGPAMVVPLTKIWISAYFIALPAVVAMLLKRFGAHPISAAPTIALLFNFSLAWGFVEFIAALVLLLLLVLALAAFEQAGSRHHLVVVALLLSALFWCHLLVQLFALAVTLLFAAMTRHSDARRWVLASVIPAVAVIVLWASTADEAGGLITQVGAYYRYEYLQSAWLRKGTLINDNRHLFAGRTGTMFAFGVSGLLVYSWLSSRSGALRTRFHDWCKTPGTPAISCLLIGALAACVFVPHRLPGEPGIFERFSVILFLSIVLVAGIERGPSATRRYMAVVATMVVLYTGLRLQYLAAFVDDSKGLREAVASVPSGELLQGVAYDFAYRGHPAYAHFQDYRMAWTIGPSVSQLATFRFYPITPVGVGLPPHRPFPHARSYMASELAGCQLTRGDLPEAVASWFSQKTAVHFGKWVVRCRAA